MKVKHLLFLAFALVIGLNASFSQERNIADMTPLAGDLSSMQTISLSGSPYLVTEDIYFNSGTHSIDPGVIIYFSQNTGLSVYNEAVLNFNGTYNYRILLTYVGQEAGQWKGVYYQTIGASTIQYTDIEKAGGDLKGNLTFFHADNVTVDHCTFNNSTGYGVFYREYSNSSISNSSVIGNGECGIYMWQICSPTFTNVNISNNPCGVYEYGWDNNTTYTDVTISNSTFGYRTGQPNRSFTYDGTDIAFVNNGTDIALEAGDILGVITDPVVVWNYYPSGYVLLGNIRVGNHWWNSDVASKLTIAPGTVVKIMPNCGLNVGAHDGSSNAWMRGFLEAIGTADNPITFTSYNGEAGGWAGVVFDQRSNDSISKMEYCVVEKAVNNITCIETDKPYINHCVVRNATEANIRLENEANITVDNTLLKNSKYGCYLKNSKPVLNNDTFDGQTEGCVWEEYGTDSYGIYTACMMKNSNYGINLSTPDKDIAAVDVVFENNFADMVVPYNQSYGISEIYGNRTWGTGTYYIAGTLVIRGPNDNTVASLTLEPGCTLQFAEGTRLQVSEQYYEPGSLIAEGTAEQPITFTAKNGQPGGWTGLVFYDPCDKFETQVSSLKHCIIENGNFNAQMIRTEQPSLIENCKFSNGSLAGLYFYMGGGTVTVKDCSFENNASYAVYSEGSSYSAAGANYIGWFEGNTFTGNLIDGVAMGAGAIDAVRTWNSLGEDYAYYIMGNTLIYESGNLTLLPGCKVKFGENVEFTVYGQLNADGTDEQPIVFTAMNGQPGGWSGFYFHPLTAGKESVMRHCVIENGGAYVPYQGTYNLYSLSTDQPLIDKCKIIGSSAHGLYMENSSATVKNTLFKDNASYGIVVGGSTSPILGGTIDGGNDFIGNNNGGYQVKSYNNINMSYSFFGTLDENYVSQNLVEGAVNVSPISQIPVSIGATPWGGSVYYDNNEAKPLAGSQIVVKDLDDNVLDQTIVTADGSFVFDSLYYKAGKIEVAPVGDLGGVNSTDALLVMRHFSQLQELEGDYLAVADVNGSNTVNNTDALLIQRRFIHAIEEFPISDAHVSINSMEMDDSFNVALSCLWTGDVNGSYMPSTRGNGLTLQYDENIVAQPYQNLVIPVKVSGIDALGAVTLAFTYPEEYLEILNVTMASSKENVMFKSGNGVLNISWYSLQPSLLQNGEVMLNIEVQVADIDAASQPVSFELKGNSELADGEGSVINEAVLSMPLIVNKFFDVGEINQEAGFAVYPNPMKNSAKVSYNLTEEAWVTVAIYSLTGSKMMQLVDERQTCGQHEAEISASAMVPGVYYCQITVGNDSKVVKIVVD